MPLRGEWGERVAKKEMDCNTPFTPSDAKLVNEMSYAFKNISIKLPCNFFFLNINLTFKTSF